MKHSILFSLSTVAFVSLVTISIAYAQPSSEQLEKWLKQYPEADANNDGKLTIDEAIDYRDRLQSERNKEAVDSKKQKGVQREFTVNAGWDQERFPNEAVCYKSAEEILAIYEKMVDRKRDAMVSFEKPTDGALRIVGTGHSFMAPGYNTLPLICKGAGFTQPLYTHVGGGMTGSSRYKWEEENGIFQFAGKPKPKLLASIANAQWDAMMWGPYFNDRPVYYSCWIDFCLKYNPEMKFYLSDAWPQLHQLGEKPRSEEFFTAEVLDRIGAEKRNIYIDLVQRLRQESSQQVYVLPTSDAMVLAGKQYLLGELPGIEGIHRAIGGKERSLWRDQLGHLGPGFERLEGYVFYATIYGRSPELIEGPIHFGGDVKFPSRELDLAFRQIAWEAVTGHPLSGVVDENHDGIKD